MKDCNWESSLPLRREFLIVIRSTGERLIAKCPVTLITGDQLLLAREEKGSQVPEGETWKVSGYTNSGPIMTTTKED